MSDLKAIKYRLREEGKVEDILRAMSCEYIGYSGGRIEAQLPYNKFQSTNKRSVQVKLNDNLSSSIRTPVGFNGGDIYELVSFLVYDKKSKQEMVDNLHTSKKFICETLGWLEYLTGEAIITKKDYLAPLKAILKGEERRREIVPNAVLPESLLDDYYYKGCPITFQDWVDEGIPHSVQSFYGVGFDLESKRVVYPLRNRFGQLVGVKGRIMRDEDDERKYLYVVPCWNRLEWFNFYLAHEYILQFKRVYIFESEKSCMKAFTYGIYNTLAIGASEISIEQAQIIMQLGLDIEIIFCYDKGIKPAEIVRQAELFRGRKVFGIFDTDNVLSGKDSPIDEGLDKWNQLVENYIYPIEVK